RVVVSCREVRAGGDHREWWWPLVASGEPRRGARRACATSLALLAIAPLLLRDPDIPKHHHLKLIVQLKTDRSDLRTLGIARRLRDYLPVQLHCNLVVARDDVHRVPIVVLLRIFRRIDETVDAARWVRVRIAVVDLDLVAEL